MHNPRVSPLLALSRVFPRAKQREKLHCRFNSRGGRANGKIKPALYSIYVLHSTSRWMLNRVGRSPRRAFCNDGILVLGARFQLRANNEQRAATWLASTSSSTLVLVLIHLALQLMYVTSGPSLYLPGIIRVRRRREVCTTYGKFTRFIIGNCVLNKLLLRAE